MLRLLTWKQALIPLLLLAVFLIWRGVIPAWTGLDTDFPNYYVAGRIVVEGGSVDRLYDDAWFQEQIARHGIDQQGKFSPFPPPTALLFVPLAQLEPLTALRTMTILNLLLLTGAVVVLARVTASRAWEAALIILLSGIGLANCLRFGQLYVVLSFSILLGFLLERRGRPLMAGIMFGWLLPVKYFPLVFLVYYAWRKEWRLVASALGTALFIALLSIGVLGWEVHRQFLTSMAGGHLQGILSQQDPFSPTFQSFDTLFRRFFVHDVRWNPAPMVDLPLLSPLLKGALVVTVGLVLVASARRVRANGADATGILAATGIAALLVAPATATYHMLLLWLPAGLLLARASGGPPGRFWTLLVAYSSIGFIPYSRLLPLDGRGLLTLLAYPRLWLLLVVYIAAMQGIGNASARGVREWKPGGSV